MATSTALPRRGRRTLEHHRLSRSSGNGTSSFIGPASSSRAHSASRQCSSCRQRSCGNGRNGGRRAPLGRRARTTWVSSGRCEKPISSACGSAAVVEEVTRMGVPEARTIITPTGADLRLFENVGDAGALRHRLGLDGQFVVGWVGSFRRFHAIEHAVDAMVGLEGATLLLVGDGRSGRASKPWPGPGTSPRCSPAPSLTTSSRCTSQPWTPPSSPPLAMRRSITRRSSSRIPRGRAPGRRAAAGPTGSSPGRRGRRGLRRRRRRTRDHCGTARSSRRPGPAGRDQPRGSRRCSSQLVVGRSGAPDHRGRRARNMSTMAASTHAPSAMKIQSARPKPPPELGAVAGNEVVGIDGAADVDGLGVVVVVGSVETVGDSAVSPTRKGRWFGNGQRRRADRCDLTYPIRAEVVVRNVRAAYGIEHDCGLALGDRLSIPADLQAVGAEEAHHPLLNRRIADVVYDNPVRSPGAALGREGVDGHRMPDQAVPGDHDVVHRTLAVGRDEQQPALPHSVVQHEGVQDARVRVSGSKSNVDRRVWLR